MKDSADIRRINKLKILKILWNGGQFSKQQLSVMTGLSIATCNTLLNDLEQTGQVTGEKKRLQDVGRDSVCYRINESYESFLCIHFDVLNGIKYLITHLLSPVGRILESTEKQYTILNYETISDEIKSLLKRYPNISEIIVGVPGVAMHGVITHCDIAEMNNMKLTSQLEQDFHIPTHMENDMHFKTYGYYRVNGKEDEIITLVNFPAHILPGTATVHAGTVLKGRNQFAGMVGFLPFGVDRKEQLALLDKNTCRPFISKAVTSLISIINPGKIILTGDLLDENSIGWISEDCMQYIPAEYMPDFVYEDNLNTYYLAGMYHKALDLKGEPR